MDGMTHGGNIGAFVESSPHPAWLAFGDGICSNYHGGLGIGLAISRSIALSHGRTLVAERRHPTGVRFSLNLPVPPSED